MSYFTPAEREHQIDVVARTMMGEAGNQGYGGMLAVGNVIANRAAANFGDYGSDFASQATAPSQFSAWNATDNGGNAQVNHRPSADAIKAATAVVDGTAPDITGGATHYNVASGAGVSREGLARQAASENQRTLYGHTFYTTDVSEKQKQAIAARAMNPADASFNPGLSPVQMALDSSNAPRATTAAPQTAADRVWDGVRSVLGAPVTEAIRLGNIAIGGVQSLADLAAKVGINSAQQQPGNPMPAQPAFQQPAHPPSTGLGAPLGAVERGSLGAPEQDLTQAAVGRLLANSPTGLAAAYQAANPKPDLSTPVGRMYAAAAAAGITPQTQPAHPPSSNPYDNGADLSARLSAADRQTPQTQPARPYSQTPASAYGWENGSPGGILGTQNDFGGGAPTSPPASMSPGVSGGGMAGGGGGGWGGPGPQPAHPHTQTPDSAYGRVTMPLGMSAPDMTGFDIGTQLSAPSTYTSVSPQTAMDEANLSAQIAALSQGPAPGAISQAKPGELGYSPPTPQISRPRPANTLQRVATTPVSLPARPQSPFIGGTSVYDDQNRIVGEVNPWGKVISQLDVAPNSPVYDQNNVQVGTLSPGQGFQAQPLQSQGFLGSLFGGFGGSSPIGSAQTSDSRAYGHQTYGTMNYGGNGGSTLGGGDNHRAL